MVPRIWGHSLGLSRGNQNNGSGQNNWRSWRSEASLWLQLVNKLLKNSLLPVVIFCFSKNRCDKSADSMYGTDLTSRSEKSVIHVFCDKAFSRLKGSDRNLPQIVRVRSLLSRGIAVHHTGLLPIVKEVVEMLFCRGVIKVLFSTETFAMGVNAPARTVVFDTLRKFDGKEFRQLLPGEYTQMAGRAGRRGIDKIGTVVVMCRDEIPDESDLKNVIVESATKLESQFRLTYIMILHLLRVEELKVEDMLKRSFAEFRSQKQLPEQQKVLMRKLAQPAKTVECIKGEPTIEEYYDLFLEAEKYDNEVAETVMQSQSCPNISYTWKSCHCEITIVDEILKLRRAYMVSNRVAAVANLWPSHDHFQAQDHLLGVVVKVTSASMKQYIVLVLKPDAPSISSNLQDNKSADFQQGYVLMPKSKRRNEDEYFSSLTNRKGSGTIKIELPYHGTAAGINYEVRGIESKELLCICDRKITIDQVRLLEDGSNAAFSKTVQQLLGTKIDGNKYPPALHPLKELKLKDVSACGSLPQMDKPATKDGIK
ncbi:hypothetical protein OIU77_028315 [Salix suchowensis]|uniref:Helicase C-terminal domain-containing protein n=1 Tax=Salix suchowensis TaxID=1278906 RepID=A0ABQ9BJ77_9ROSI|nr:hypothetical protein OIU77_028315 [Salix suchowensis]